VPQILEEDGRQVALPEIRQHRNDQFACALRAFRYLDGCVDRRSGRDSHEKAFFPRKALRHGNGGLVGDLHDLVDQVGPQHVGNETAADLIPAIAQGVVLAGTPGAGERFIQPRVGASLLDDFTGGGWRLFVGNSADGSDEAGVTCINAATLDDGGAVVRWLDLRGVEAVLLRPDHYVFGTGEPETLLAARKAALRLPMETLA